MSSLSWPRRSVAEHLHAILAALEPLPPRRVLVRGLRQGALSRLAEPARAALPVPAFSASAVDGFLLIDPASPPSNGGFRVVADVPAGAAPVCPGPGEAVRVMTGAPVPEVPGVRVVPVENTDAHRTGPAPDRVLIRGLREDRNIRRIGEHLTVGDVVAEAGCPLDPGTLAALVAAGVASVMAHPAPRVTLITTGDEVHDSDEAAGSGPGRDYSIPDSNGVMLGALLRAAGARSVELRHAPDHAEELVGILDEAARTADLILTVGGISAGAYDAVRQAGEAAGTVGFGPVALSPGRPHGAGRWAGTPLLCLPGNPVAAWVGFQLFARPVLGRLAGAPPGPVTAFPHVRLVAAGALRARPRAATALPARIDWPRGRVHARGIRSHEVASLAGADGLIFLEAGRAVSAGEPVDVFLC